MPHGTTAVAYKEDDTRPVLRDTLHRDGDPLDIEHANEVRFYLKQFATGDLVVNDATNVTVVDGPNGEVEYEFQDGDLGEPGYYVGEWRVEFADSGIQRVPESGYLAVEVDDALGTVGAATVEDSDLTVSNLTVGDTFSLGNDGPATSFSDITGATDVTLEDNGATVTTTLDVLNLVSGFSVTEPVTDEVDVSVDESTFSSIPNSALANSSVTVTAGNALTGGGSSALGGAGVTLDVVEGDINAQNLDNGGDFEVGARDITSDGQVLWNYTNDSWTADINTPFANIDELLFPDKGLIPSVNGEMAQDGNDILAYSGGALRNLSNIGAGGGAPTDAAYLTLAAESGLSNETVVDSYPFVSADLATDAVTATEIATGAVTTSEVLDGTLTRSDWSTEEFQDEVGAMVGAGLSYDDPNGQLDVTSSGFTQVNATNNYTASDGDSVWADGSSSSVPVTLPSPSKSAEVRIVATDTTNPVSVTESASEGIQTPLGQVSSYVFVANEAIRLESDGTTWRFVSDLTTVLDSGQLGTLQTANDSQDFTITNVAGSETQPISDVVVFPRSDINEDYAFNDIDWYSEWDESAGELDVVVTVVWDTKPSTDLDLDYKVS